MPNIIDSLVVQLSLDSKKMSEGAVNAANRLQDLENRTKKLARQEELANRAAEISAYLERQRAQNTQRTSSAARQLEVQSARTRLELSAASKVGVDLFAAVRGGMVGLAGAMGVGALGAFVQQTITAGANVERMARTIGISSRDLQKWEQAGTNLVAGATPQGIDTAFQTLSNQANLLETKGESPTALLEAANRLAPYNGGKRVETLTDDGKMLPLQDILLNLADPVKRAGLPRSMALLGPELGGDMVTLSSSFCTAPDEALRQNLQHLENAFGNFGKTLVNDATPALIRFTHDMGDMLHSVESVVGYVKKAINDPKGAIQDAVKAVDDAEPNETASNMSPADARAKAHDMLKYQLPKRGANEGFLEYTRRLMKNSTFHVGKDSMSSWWDRVTKVDPAKEQRLAELMMGGLSPNDAMRQLQKEAGGAPVLAIPEGGWHTAQSAREAQAPFIAAQDRERAARGDFGNAEGQYALPAGILTAMRGVESGGRNRAVSPKGAVGPFQFMPATAAKYGLKDRTNLVDSAYAAAHLLSDLYAKYHDWQKALAGYNWGEGDAAHPRLDADIAAHGNDWLKFAPDETQKYIGKLSNIARMWPTIPQPGGSEGGITIVQNGTVNINTQATDAAGIKKAWTNKVATNALHGPA